jgi:hypothetical protein
MGNRPAWTGRKPTLIVVSRTLAEANAAFAGMTLEVSSATSMASIAAFSEERAPFHAFGRWGLSVIVETQGSCEKTATGVMTVRNGELDL